MKFKSFLIILVLFFIKKTTQQNNEHNRIDCYPEAAYSLYGDSLFDKCKQRNCEFQSSNTPGVPWCFFPQETYGYTMTSSVKVTNGYNIFLKLLTKYQSPFPESISNLKLEVEYLSKKILHFKITDANNKRYEVPIELNDVKDKLLNEADTEYDFTFENRNTDSVFVIKIKRKSTGTILFDTNLGGMVFCNQFLQIATRLPTGSNIYGFGENNHPSISHDLNYKSWGIFARDHATPWGENANQYGVQPFYTVVEEDGNAHGVLLLNSNAMDYSFTPYPALILRTIGGVFDFYLFTGSEPETVAQQFTSLVGRPFMIPYFALGFQLSRWNYKDLADMKRVIESNIAAGIPLDVQYADIEHFKDNMDFTVDESKFGGLQDYFKELQTRGMRVVIILDPALVVSRGNSNYKPFVEGKNNDVFIKWPQGLSPDFSETNSDIMLGYCWPGDKVAYPDFMNNRTKAWWKSQIIQYRAVNISFDGLWIDMNEPVVFNTNEDKPWNWPDDKLPLWTLKCPNNKWDDPPYRTKAVFRFDSNGQRERLSQTTLCMVGQHSDGALKHYDVHNLYGFSEAQITLEATRAATGKRSFVLTRSTFIGSGRYAGHWLGDNEANTRDMHRSIIGMIEFGMFGIPYNGADICGFFGTSDEELCTRWQQIGAFYPFSRNHNSDFPPHQDPASFSQHLIDSTKKILKIRYTILPYYYTLFYNAHKYGNLVIKGLFQEFPTDKTCRTIDRQFLVGSGLLVSPVLERGQTVVSAYLPPSSKWYNYYDGSLTNTGQVTLSAPLNFINVHVRGGYILPTQEPANNTHYSRNNPFGLIVALNQNLEASGELYYDDGDSIDSIESSKYFLAKFNFKSGELSMTIQTNQLSLMNSLKLNTIRIMGLRKIKNIDSNSIMIISNPNSETRTAQTVQIDDIKLNQFGELQIQNLKLNMNNDFVIKFNLNVDLIVPPLVDVDINDDRLRIDCHPQSGAYESKCISMGCSWVPSQIPGAPWCFINKHRIGYTVQSSKKSKNSISASYDLLKTDSFSMYGSDINKLKVSIEYKGSSMVRIQFKDADKKRYEVPIQTTWNDQITDIINDDVNKNDFDVYIENDLFGRFVFEVFRKSTGTRLISTREYAEGFIYSDKYIQLYARLASESVYGWGESTHESFRHKFNYDSPVYPLFARDEPPLGGNKALYGVHPFYLCVENDGSSHGLLILNSNAQEYRLSALKTLSYKTIGGILDIFMFSGPTPEDVIRQYTNLIGKPFLPPYFALGFQLCRYGYNSLNNLKAAVNRTLAAQIPLDIQYSDIDHFDHQLDFTYDQQNFNGLPGYVDYLKTQGIQFIIILDPALITSVSNYLPYQRGQQQDVWIKWPSNMNPQFSETGNNNILGYVWPEGKVVFPDFFQNKTVKWWSDEIKLFYNTIKFDGLWIDMNEPANFGTNQNKPFNWPAGVPDWSLKCPTNEFDDPPYRTIAAFGDRLSDKTICLVAEQTDGINKYKHYDVHNLYGYTETLATVEALKQTLPTKRPLVISRSTFPSSGKHAGHWLGDNESVWKQLKYNLIGLLEFNLFGIPYVGADICGFFGNADSELCTRWMQLGAFNPFFRNHNSINQADQDPGSFGSSVANTIRKVVEIRYSLLPYLYTLFYEAHIYGGTVVRSLVHEFSKDKNVHDIDSQFLWGSGLLISPVLEQGKTQVSAYFPPLSRWYDFYNGKEITGTGSFINIAAPLDVIPLHVRGGYIIPTQDSAMNTKLSRKNPFGVIVAPDGSGKAKGSLYFDDGESIDSISSNLYNVFRFDFDKSTGLFQSRVEHANYSPYMNHVINTIKIFDISVRPFQVLINGMYNHAKVIYNADAKYLELYDLQITFNKYFYIALK